MSEELKNSPDTKEDGGGVTPCKDGSAGVGRKLTSVKGDLFSCPASDSLAHCISEDCRMGAGVAVKFRKTFGRVKELQAQKRKKGDCAILQLPDRFVYYLITKERYFHKPTYDSLRHSLEAMRTHCLANGVTRVSMPRIACGLDRLSWAKVSVMIEEVFLHTDVTITVYII